ncbi:hypothetical protein D3C79_858520 [compost metagenome]
MLFYREHLGWHHRHAIGPASLGQACGAVPGLDPDVWGRLAAVDQVAAQNPASQAPALADFLALPGQTPLRRAIGNPATGNLQVQRRHLPVSGLGMGIDLRQ